MNYRRLGKSGLLVSELSLGSWVTYGNQVGESIAYDCMKVAYDAGVNFFDNAEAYAEGNAETVMGNVLKKMGWRRESYVVSAKIYWGGKGPNDIGLSYKHIIEGTNNSLRRLQLDYVDLIFCHEPDPNTPIEESIWAMDQVIRQGKALYWGTSSWSAADIMAAYGIARENNLRPPTMEQPEYNLLKRYPVEVEYQPLYKMLGLGLTTWSPLASGLLTGKYNDGIPANSRASMEENQWLRERITPDVLNKVKILKPIAENLQCTVAQLALAWCLLNKNVSTVITGASRVEQVHQNLEAIDIVNRITAEIKNEIESVFIYTI
jgi:voltage-dependent potassium channel beta subunit